MITITYLVRFFVMLIGKIYTMHNYISATSRAPIDSFELEDQDVDFDGIRLKWNRVEIPSYGADEQPLLYMIEMNEPPLDEWRPIVSGLPTTRYRVTDLVPDRDYHFRVRALSSYGVSPPSYTLPVSYRRPLPGKLICETYLL